MGKTNTLAKCPCGKTPTKILIGGASFSGLRQAFGDCCHYWRVEFRLNTKYYESTEKAQAVDAWNKAPRGTP